MHVTFRVIVYIDMDFPVFSLKSFCVISNCTISVLISWTDIITDGVIIHGDSSVVIMMNYLNKMLESVDD